MYPSNILEAVIYISGVALVFFMVPSALMFGLTELICRKIEKTPAKAVR
jgi:hypothetical protein